MSWNELRFKLVSDGCMNHCKSELQGESGMGEVRKGGLEIFIPSDVLFAYGVL